MTSRAEPRSGPGRRLTLALVACALMLGGPATRLQAEDLGAARQAMARAGEYRARGDNRAARIELMNAIKAAPRLPAARIAQARVFLSLFDAAGAEAELGRAIELGADRDIVRAPMAEALLLQ
ncbi:MAG: hypothetical protein KYX66_13695, partial [Blastomonas fulva]|nr:hypothetical protein [Blastomonas fulva]